MKNQFLCCLARVAPGLLFLSLLSFPHSLGATDTGLLTDDDRPEEVRAGVESALRPASAAVTVVASRIPAQEPGSTVRVLTREDISALPVRSVSELLQWMPGIDVRRRGAEGIQADVGIRGADFNGTVVLVDGEPVNDPQTNHFSMDLDIPMDAIERVEVLYGSASALYGSGAVGGVVNIVTRAAYLGRGRAQVEGRYAHGSDSLDVFGVRLASRLGDSAAVAVDWGRGESSGFMDDREFSSHSGRLSARWDSNAGPLTLTLGRARRKFGAYAFYGTRYPNQYEETKTETARLAGDFKAGEWTVSPSVALRTHDDDFILERSDPSFYRNIHESRTETARLSARRPFLGGQLVLGTEGARESIESTNLGDHTRDRLAAFLEFGTPLVPKNPDKAALRLGLRWDRYEDFGSRLTPQISLSYGLTPLIRLRTSAGTAFRVPTFTELYYSDPQTLGNPDLAPEQAFNLDAGINVSPGIFLFDGGVFYRDSKDVIDYVRSSADEKFTASNIRSNTVWGLEFLAEMRPRSRTRVRFTRLAVQTSYNFVDLAKLSAEAGGATEGRYVLDPLHSKWDFVLAGILPLEIAAQTRLSRYSRPSLSDAYWLWDARIGRQLLEGQILEIYVEGQNLSDTEYQERPGVPMPGRTLLVGARLTW